MAKVTFDVTMKDLQGYISPYELAEAMVSEITNNNLEYWSEIVGKDLLKHFGEKEKNILLENIINQQVCQMDIEHIVNQKIDTMIRDRVSEAIEKKINMVLGAYFNV